MELRLSSSAPLINFVYNVEQQTHVHSLFHVLTGILITELKFPVIEIETVLTKFKHLLPYNRVHTKKVCLLYKVMSGTIQECHLKKVFKGYKTLNY